MIQSLEKLNLLVEWIHLASRVFSKSTTQTTANSIAERYSIEVETLHPYINACIVMEEKLLPTIDASMKDFEFFFAPLNQNQSLAQLLVSILLNPHYSQSIDTLTPHQWLHAFINGVATVLEEDDVATFKETHHIHDLATLNHVIMNSELDESARYRLIVASNQPTWCVHRIQEMYCVHEKEWVALEDEMNQLVSKTLTPWMNQHNHVYDLIESSINIKGLPQAENILIIPSLFNFNSFMVVNQDPFAFDLKQPLLHIGFLIFDLTHTLHQLSENQQRFHLVLKTLADKSKLEILRLCQDQALYGQQVASHLHITTATASYHLNALVNMGYLSMTVQANRIYYETQSKKITSDLQLIQNLFTPKD